MKNFFKWVGHGFRCLTFSLALLCIIAMIYLVKEWYTIGHPLNLAYFGVFAFEFMIMCLAIYPIVKHKWYTTEDEIKEEYKYTKKLHFTGYVLILICVLSVGCAAYGYQRPIAEYDTIQAEIAMRDDLQVTGLAVSIMRTSPRYIYDTLAYVTLREAKNDSLTYAEAEDLLSKTKTCQLFLYGGLIIFGITRFILFRHECWVKNRDLITGGKKNENNSVKN